ncbi:MAG: hypothetical protein O2803_14560, partial [Chloroflexi bacterium]|nr:hypothetical protein [Chloroflexota bacterium]
NDRLARALDTNMTAGEVRPPPQEVFSSSEIKATLGLMGDISTIGFHSEEIKLKSRFWRSNGMDPSTIDLENIIEKSVETSALTFPADVRGARAASLIVHGRPEHLFTQSIAAGRGKLEELTTVGKVRYGDYPDRKTKSLSAITIVSGITDFSRLDDMRRRVNELNGSNSPRYHANSDQATDPSLIEEFRPRSSTSTPSA